MLDPHAALIYTMVIVSAVEADLPEAELQMMGDIVGHLPVFGGFDRQTLPAVLNDCAEALARDGGLEQTLEAIKQALPPRLRETAYAIACDLVAASGKAGQGELQALELIRHRLDVDRLTAAAIERGARARLQRL